MTLKFEHVFPVYSLNAMRHKVDWVLSDPKRRDQYENAGEGMAKFAISVHHPNVPGDQLEMMIMIPHMIHMDIAQGILDTIHINIPKEHVDWDTFISKYGDKIHGFGLGKTTLEAIQHAQASMVE